MSRDFSDGGRIEVDGPDGFRMIPDTLMFSLNVQHLDIRIYGILLWYGFRVDRRERKYPGRQKLAELVGVKSVRTIDSSLERLQAEGYLTITPQYNSDGSQDYNRYKVHFSPLPPEQRQLRTKKDKPDANPAPEGGRNELHGGVKTPEAEGVQSVAPPREGETGYTPRGATDCTGGVQPDAHLKRNNFQKGLKEVPDSFANAQESAGAPIQETLGGMPQPAKPPAATKPAPEPLPELTAPPETREQALPYAKQLASGWLAYLKDQSITVIDRSKKARAGSSSQPFWVLTELFASSLIAGATEFQVKRAMRAAFDASGNAVPPASVFERHLHAVQGNRAMPQSGGNRPTNLHIDPGAAEALQRAFEAAL